MSRKKTYTAVGMSNLNTEGEENRWAQINVLRAQLSGIGAGSVYVMDNQRGDAGSINNGAGVRHRNYILWARDKPFSDYNNEDKYGDTGDSTFDDLINMVSPTISAEIGLTEDTLETILEDKFNITLTSETLTNQEITVDAITTSGSKVSVTITTDITRTWYCQTDISYIGGYDLETLGKAYIYQNGDVYKYGDGNKSGWFGYGLITGDTYVFISPGNAASDVDYDEEQDEIDAALNPDYEVSEGDEVQLTGEALDAWFFWGYNTTEEHVDEETNETVTEEVFNEEEQEYIYLDNWLQDQVGDYNTKDTVFYVLAGYVYAVDIIDAYETQDGLILVQFNDVTQAYEPVQKLEGETMTLYHYYSWELEDYQSTYTKEAYSRIDLDNIKFFSLVLNNEDALNDPVLGGTTEETETEDLLFSPPITFKHDKTWYTEDNAHDWYWRHWRACKQAMGDSDYFDEVFDSLQESLTDGKIAWVYFVFGLPTNMCQLNYCAHYAIQFFKMLTVSNWRNINRGQEFTSTTGSRSYTINANTFNYHFQFSWSSVTYASGSGLCPAPGYSDIRPGEGGVCTYEGKTTIWRQEEPDAWEYVQPVNYETKFTSIKNGKSRTIATDGWTDAIWETEGVTRNYSENIIPLSKVIFNEIPIADFTDIMQYCYNIGVTAYKVVKKKWYQTGLFQIIMVIIVIVITIIASIYGGPAGGAAAGTAGSAILGGAYALLWNIVINIAVSIIVAYVLQIVLAPILTKVFGDVIGQIFTTIISIYVSMKLGGAIGSMNTNAGTMTAIMTDPKTWLQAINAGMQGYSNMVAKKVQAIQNKTDALADTVEEIQNDIDQAIAENLGGGNILKYVNDALYTQKTPADVESVETFFKRVFLSGSDIAEITMQCHDEFADIYINNSPIAQIIA